MYSLDPRCSTGMLTRIDLKSNKNTCISAVFLHRIPDVSIKSTRPKVPVGEVPYTLSLNAHFQSAYGIAKIESNCNITPLEYTDSDNTRAKVSLAEGHKFDRDVELLVYYLDVTKPSVTVEAGLGATDAAQESGPTPSGSIMAESVAMFNFHSSLSAGHEQSNCGEFIFLVDRSGSMGWSMSSEPKSPKRIQSAKETLVLLLKSLPLGCYFNIYGFGSHFESFFPESVEYTQQSMEEAVKKVNKMNAKFGGTEILKPLKNIYQTDGRAGHLRQLFVLTDGEVRNTKQVIKEVQKNAQNHRCFTFGIGEGASTSLIKGMARAGNGIYDFIIGKDRIQPKVLRALRYSLQPPVKDVSLTWTLPSGMEAIVLSEVPTAIFPGQSSIVYAQLNGKVENEAEGEVCLQYKFNDEIIKNTLHFLLTVQNAERPTIHRLAAKALISDLGHGSESESEEVKKKILETSLQSGVVSSLTAYVAVNEDTKTPVEGTPVTRDPPLLALKSYDLIDCPSIASPIRKQAKSGAAPRKVAGWFRKMASSAANLFRTSKETPEEETEAPPPPAEPAENPTLVRLISLQNADGSWDLTPEFSAVLGISKTDIKTGNPDQNMEVSVWVTVLAVIWLHTTCLDQREEWELLEGKAVSWIRDKAGSSLSEFVRVGNELLKSSMDPKVFGL
ncbi:von Willebrand factor A domain-containing protein 5A-like isoform X2 [Aquarana catesbeiana]|uniref:von Willebrand factor A domain-containing protein 5A-like isoform X2 n=1 Tax=Aquarana catesbeiana TaxID=8400 RepID=UPI003CC927D3